MLIIITDFLLKLTFSAMGNQVIIHTYIILEPVRTAMHNVWTERANVHLAYPSQGTQLPE